MIEDKPARIVFVVQNYPPESGAVKYTYNLAKWSNQMGYKVTVITAHPHYPTGKPYSGYGKFKPRISTEDNIKVIRIPLIMASNRQRIRRTLGFISFVCSAIPWLFFMPRPDIIVSSIPPATVSIAGFIASMIRRIPIITILRDTEPISSLTLRKKKIGPIWRLINKVFMGIYKGAKNIIIINESQRKYLVEYGIDNSKISCIAHNINLDEYNSQVHNPGNIKLPRRSNRAMALYVGTFGVCHDLENFLTLLTDERIRKLEIDFIFVGDGERLPDCQQIVLDEKLQQVTLLPPVSVDYVPGILNQADLLICSSVDYPFSGIGSKIIEYCASGKPIMLHGSKLGREFIDKIGNGWSCRNGDGDALYKSLNEFISIPNEWNRIGAKGIKYVSRHFNSDLNYKKLQNILGSIIQSD